MKKLSLLTLDIGLLFGSLYLALALRYHQIHLGTIFHSHLLPFTIIFGVWLIIFYIGDMYNVRIARNDSLFYSKFIRLVSISAVISTAFFYYIPLFGITPKTNLFIFAIVFGLLDSAGRALFNVLVRTKFRKFVLIIGSNERAQEISKFIKANPQLGHDLIDLVHPNNISDIDEIIAERKIHAIVVSPEAYDIPNLIDLFYRNANKRIIFYNLSDFYELMTGKVPLEAIDQSWFLSSMNREGKRGYEIAKRLIDTVLGTLLAVISLVFYPIIIIGIALTSRGPIFYTQRRVGQSGSQFTVIKFRSMINNAEQHTGPAWASTNDTRVTGFGRFLRNTRLDELPQFWTVVTGDMSLIGPRAERPEFHEVLKSQVPFYEERYLVKPGLTGWAQINFQYSATIEDTKEKVQYDLYYIKNRSVALDFSILLKTIRISLSQAGN